MNIHQTEQKGHFYGVIYKWHNAPFRLYLIGLLKLMLLDKEQ